MQSELEALENALGNPHRPLMAVVGGAKVSTKLDLLSNLIEKVDILVIGGAMANTFLAAQGLDVGRSLCEHDMADTARAIAEKAAKTGCEVILPRDVVVAEDLREGAAFEIVRTEDCPEEAMILDAGPDSVFHITQAMDRAATLIWNGPLGAFETPALRRRHQRRGGPRGGALPLRQAHRGRRRRRHRRGAQPGRRGGLLQLHLHRRRRLPRMDGRQDPPRRRRAGRLTPVPAPEPGPPTAVP